MRRGGMVAGRGWVEVGGRDGGGGVMVLVAEGEIGGEGGEGVGGLKGAVGGFHAAVSVLKMG